MSSVFANSAFAAEDGNPIVELRQGDKMIKKPIRDLTPKQFKAYKKQLISEDLAQLDKKPWVKEMKDTLDDRIQWWRQGRFGCFVHWGVYSDLSGIYKGKKHSGYSEHIQRKAMINQADYYNDVVKPFNPTEFNAEEWVQLMHNAGMKYLIITAKHHDGFAMYPSKVTDWNLTDKTEFKRDPMKELSDACKKVGMKFGFYYSQAFDWGEAKGSGNDWEFNRPGGDKKLYDFNDWWIYYPKMRQEVKEEYMDKKAIPQVLELLEMYNPDIMWFDTPHKVSQVDNARVLDAMRETGWKGIVNSRLTQLSKDYQSTGDQSVYFRDLDWAKYWESIPTTNNSYGYSSHDKSYKDKDQIIRNIISAASFGGNTLMNIGPMGNGKVGPEDTKILKHMGTWFPQYGESFYGTEKSGLIHQDWGVVTRKGNTLYAHVFAWPKNGELVLGGLKSKILSAKLWRGDRKEKISFERIAEEDIRLILRGQAVHSASSVIELTFEGDLQKGSKSRLIDPTTPSQLLVFHAEVTKGMRFQSGTPTRYGVEGWHKDSQRISWKFRAHKPGKVKADLIYSGVRRPNNGDEYFATTTKEFKGKDTKLKPEVQVWLNDKLVHSFVANKFAWDMITEALGELDIPAGESLLELRGKNFFGRENCLPAEIKLTPVK